jgi:membrane protein HdeD
MNSEVQKMKFITKLLINGVIVIPLMIWFSHVTFLQAACTSVVLSVIAYFVGDQFILRQSNNTVATIADVVLSFLYLWLVAYVMNWDLSLMEIFVISVILGVAEAVFHRFLTIDDKKATA